MDKGRRQGSLAGCCGTENEAGKGLRLPTLWCAQCGRKAVRAVLSLRHTALTRLAEAGCDAFTLARIAGHSSITITQRYCHPQAEAIERAFKKMLRRHNFGHRQETRNLERNGSRLLNTSV